MSMFEKIIAICGLIIVGIFVVLGFIINVVKFGLFGDDFNG